MVSVFAFNPKVKGSNLMSGMLIEYLIFKIGA
jgi:hypothetical protein